MRFAYADPPYPGHAKRLYGDHPDYAGEVDHRELALTLSTHYDGWALHTASTTLPEVLGYIEQAGIRDYRLMAWVKPFAVFRRNVPVAYAWEPVIVKAARTPLRIGVTYRDFISESITMKRGLAGAKPEAVCRWLFEVMGCEPEDELDDLFPGTGAVSAAWKRWSSEIFGEIPS